MADIVAALVAILKADAAVAALAGDRVHGIELPAGEAAAMPGKGVVVRPAGGISPVGGYAEHTGGRVDVISWGETPYEAERLAGAVYLALKGQRRAVVATGAGDVLVHWIEEAGGRLSLRDAETDWPAAVQPFQVFYAARAAA